MEENMNYNLYSLDNAIENLIAYIEDNKPSKKDFISFGMEFIGNKKKSFASRITPPSDYNIFYAELDRRFEGLLFTRF